MLCGSCVLEAAMEVLPCLYSTHVLSPTTQLLHHMCILSFGWISFHYIGDVFVLEFLRRKKKSHLSCLFIRKKLIDFKMKSYDDCFLKEKVMMICFPIIYFLFLK